MTLRSLVWVVLPALLSIVSAARADIAPPVHDATCTAAARARVAGQCIECCMGDGCPNPEVRCPAEERFRHQICVRHPNPPESRLTYGVWCDPDMASSRARWLIGLGVAVAVVVGVAAVAAVWTVSRSRKRSS